MGQQGQNALEQNLTETDVNTSGTCIIFPGGGGDETARVRLSS